MRSNLPLLILVILASVVACGPTDSDVDPEPEQCPTERSHLCPDDSCAIDAERCPGEPQPIEGELTAMSPGTVHGAAPEVVTVELSVSHGADIQAFLDQGARFEVSLRDSGGDEIVSVDEVTASEGAEEGIFEIRFTPGVEERKRIRKQVRVQLVTDDDGQLYSWGIRHLGFPEGVEDIAVQQRSASALNGITEAQHVWQTDLDGDGFDDLVVLDVDDETFRLLVYRCDDEKCSDPMEVELVTEDESGSCCLGQILAPDMIASPGGDPNFDEETGRYIIAYPSLVNSGNGGGGQGTIDVREVEHLSIRLIEGEDRFVVEEERVKIALPVRDDTNWLVETLKPRLVHDPVSGDTEAGISIFSRQDNRGHISLNHVFLQHAQEPVSQPLFIGVEGLDDPGHQAAINGQVSTCPVDELYQDGPESPDGRLVSLFEADGMAMVVIGSSTSPDQMLQAHALPAGLDVLTGDQGSTVCKLTDLDGDGDLDVALSVQTPEGRALLVSLTDSSTDQLIMSTPELVVDGLADDSWEFFRDGDDLYLGVPRSGRNPQTGKEIKIAHEVQLDLDVDGDRRVSVTVQNTPPTTSGYKLYSWGSSKSSRVVGGKKGYDYLSADRSSLEPFADGINSADADGGLFLGSEQLIGSGGMWVAAHFSGGLTAGDGDEASLLRFGDPKTIIGWLSTTGPFLPVETMSDKSSPKLMTAQEALSLHDMSGGDAEGAAEASVLSLIVNEEGESTGIRIKDFALVDGQPEGVGESEVELDFSEAELATKNVVKFKAGAELSKTAAAPGDDDCDDADTCPAPPATHFVFVMDSGEMAGAVIRGKGGGSGKVSIQKLSACNSCGNGIPDFEEISFESLGGAPVLGERRPPIGVDVWESAASRYTDTELSQGQGEDRQTLIRTDSRIFIGDFQGLGHAQILEAKRGEEETQICGTTNHLSIGGGVGQGDLDSLEEALDRQAQSVCIPDDESIAIVDLNGDRCQDLVFVDSRRALLSRCDGTFEPELALLGDWSGHLGEDDGWVTKAQDYNSSRSNKPSTIAWIGDADEDDDNDGFDDEVIIVVPFHDGLQRLR